MFSARLLTDDFLDTFQACALLANVFTLFIGIMLIVTSFLEQQAIQAGENFDSTKRDVISVIVFIANMAVIGLPFLRALAAGHFISNAKSSMEICLGKDDNQLNASALKISAPALDTMEPLQEAEESIAMLPSLLTASGNFAFCQVLVVI